MESGVYGAQCSFEIVSIAIVAMSQRRNVVLQRFCEWFVLLILCAALMIIKRFVVVTKSHWHILWADVARLLSHCRRNVQTPESWDEVKYISTWPGIVNVDLFARQSASLRICGWRRLMALRPMYWYWYTLFWLGGRVEPNAMIYLECWTRPTTAFELLFAYTRSHRVVRLFIFIVVFSAFLLLLLIKEKHWDSRPPPHAFYRIRAACEREFICKFSNVAHFWCSRVEVLLDRWRQRTHWPSSIPNRRRVRKAQISLH